MRRNVGLFTAEPAFDGFFDGFFDSLEYLIVMAATSGAAASARGH